jgi:hypothetical protein
MLFLLNIECNPLYFNKKISIFIKLLNKLNKFVKYVKMIEYQHRKLSCVHIIIEFNNM